jgi:hypothetical protein
MKHTNGNKCFFSGEEIMASHISETNFSNYNLRMNETRILRISKAAMPSIYPGELFDNIQSAKGMGVFQLTGRCS